MAVLETHRTEASEPVRRAANAGVAMPTISLLPNQFRVDSSDLSEIKPARIPHMDNVDFVLVPLLHYDHCLPRSSRIKTDPQLVAGVCCMQRVRGSSGVPAAIATLRARKTVRSSQQRDMEEPGRFGRLAVLSLQSVRLRLLDV